MLTLTGRKQNSGFTIAELLTVAAIIGVLVAVSIPLFAKQMNKAREAVDFANERASMAAAMADFYSNGYNVQSGSPTSGHYYQYHYDAKRGQVVLQIPQNYEKIRSIQPYGHRYTLTMQDPVRMFTGWTEFKNHYSSNGYHYYGVGNTVDNTDKIVTVMIYNNDNGTVNAAEWWINPATANISGISGK